MDPMIRNETSEKNTIKMTGESIITNWKGLRVASPQNLTEKVGDLKETKKIIKKQKETLTELSTSYAV